jgi:hypothetical protein
MSLGTFQRKAWVRLLHFCANDGDAIRPRVSHDGNQSNVLIAGGHPKQRCQCAAAAYSRENRRSELDDRQIGNLAKRNRLAGVEG